jgi:hypothetical protein
MARDPKDTTIGVLRSTLSHERYITASLRSEQNVLVLRLAAEKKKCTTLAVCLRGALRALRHVHIECTCGDGHKADNKECTQNTIPAAIDVLEKQLDALGL